MPGVVGAAGNIAAGIVAILATGLRTGRDGFLGAAIACVAMRLAAASQNKVRFTTLRPLCSPGQFGTRPGARLSLSAKNAAQRQRNRHVAFDFQLAHHEGHLGILLARRDIHEIGHAHLDAASGRAIFIADDHR